MDAASLVSAGVLGGLSFALALGLVIGSFLNVVIHRLPRGESIVRPRSHCPACGQPIAAWENVPVLSFLWLRGRCRGCAEPISLRYPLVELLTGGIFALLIAVQGVSFMTPLWLAFAAALIAVAAIDFDHRMIPDQISLGGLAVGWIAVPALRWLDGASYPSALLESGLGALLGGGLLWAVGFAHARISTALGRSFEHWPGEGEEVPRPTRLDYWVWFPGLGFGDVKLLAMIGAFVGPYGVLETILAAALVGLLLGLGWAVVERSWSSPFGFAPAIAIGAIGVLISPVHLLGAGW
jgi:leader peptidase (prepilin peptidase)/N-methyltransferase